MKTLQVIQRDEWLTEALKRPCYQFLDHFPLKEVFESEIESNGFVYSKTSVDDIGRIAAFEKLGFQLVDTNVVYEGLPSQDFDKDTVYDIRFAEREDALGVQDVAENSFHHSRFHLDPKFKQEEADFVKSQWAGNYFLGKRGTHMIVAEIDGQIRGFLQLILKEGNLLIDLIAVDPSAQKKGLAKAMIGFAATLPGAERLTVGTQLANRASICLYEKLGFQFKEAKYIFHYHKADA